MKKEAFVSTVSLPLALILTLMPGPSTARDFRIEGGAGIVHGNHDFAFSGNTGPAELSIQSDEAIGGTGFAGSVAVWMDRVWLDTVSLGLEYLYTASSSDVGLGVSVAGQSARLQTDLDLRIHSLMLNGALRANDGMLHPYIGLGVGLSHLNGKVNSDVLVRSFTNANFNVINEDEDILAPSVQGFIGVDYDVAERVYVGATARYYLIDARLFESDEVIREVMLQAKIGIRF